MTTALFKPYTREKSSLEDEQLLRDHAEQRVDVLPADPEMYDAEVGPMYDITFPDGFKGTAFEDELSEWSEEDHEGGHDLTRKRSVLVMRGSDGKYYPLPNQG
jgi:hypothetical protein